jgi:hypothetical protein
MKVSEKPERLLVGLHVTAVNRGTQVFPDDTIQPIHQNTRNHELLLVLVRGSLFFLSENDPGCSKRLRC